jgi:hypothetical protein
MSGIGCNMLSSASVDDGSARSFEEPMYRTLRWRLIPFLMLRYVLASLDYQCQLKFGGWT